MRIIRLMTAAFLAGVILLGAAFPERARTGVGAPQPVARADADLPEELAEPGGHEARSETETPQASPVVEMPGESDEATGPDAPNERAGERELSAFIESEALDEEPKAESMSEQSDERDQPASNASDPPDEASGAEAPVDALEADSTQESPAAEDEVDAPEMAPQEEDTHAEPPPGDAEWDGAPREDGTRDGESTDEAPPEGDPQDEAPPDDEPPEGDEAEGEPLDGAAQADDAPEGMMLLGDDLPDDALMDDALEGETEQEPFSGELALGSFAPASAQAGGALTLALPVRYAVEDRIYESNARTQGGIAPFDGDLSPDAFDQSITEALAEVVLVIAPDQEDGFPLSPDILGLRGVLLTDGVNRGYAVFEDLPVLEEAEPGLYPIRLRASWRDVMGGEQVKALGASLEVTAQAASGDVTLGDYAVPATQAGSLLTLAVPIRYTDGQEDVYESNAGEDGGILPYQEDRQAQDYSQALAEELTALTISIAAEQEEGFPLSPDVLSESHALLADGQNLGYAVFEELPVREDAEPGEYPVRLTVSWTDASGQAQSKGLLAALSVDAAAAVYQDGIIVYNFSELKNAIEGGQYDKVYLGYDAVNQGTITYSTTGGISMPRSLSRLEIVGTDPENGRRMTLVDYGSLSEHDTLQTTTAGQTIILKSVNVTGKNWYGILHSSLLYTSHFVFEDVEYYGIAMSTNNCAQSSVTFNNCRVTLTNATYGIPQEAAETRNIYFYGYNTFERVTNPASLYAVFALLADGYFYVDRDATVKVITNLYGFNLHGHGTAVGRIEGKMEISSQNNSGCMQYAHQYFKEITIARGGSLKLTHDGTTYGSLRAKNLTVEGTLDIFREKDASPCLAISYTGSAKFNSPERVRLVNPKGNVLCGTNTWPSTLEITTQAMNRENNTGKAIWNNNDLSPFQVKAQLPIGGTTSSVTTTLQNGGKGAALGAPVLSTTNFDLFTATRLEFGEYTLSIDPTHEGAPAVSGRAATGTALTVERYGYSGGFPVGGVIQSVTGITAQGGRYQTPENAWIYVPAPAYDETCVYVRGVYDKLEAHVYVPCLPGCFLYDVPDSLDFGDVSISNQPRLLRRQETDWTIQVFDTLTSGDWTLCASAGPLRTADGEDVLAGGLVFVSPEKGTQFLSPDSSLPIAVRPPGAVAGITEINWPADEGLMLSLQAMAGKQGAAYGTTITWTLEVVP